MPSVLAPFNTRVNCYGQLQIRPQKPRGVAACVAPRYPALVFLMRLASHALVRRFQAFVDDLRHTYIQLKDVPGKEKEYCDARLRGCRRRPTPRMILRTSDQDVRDLVWREIPTPSSMIARRQLSREERLHIITGESRVADTLRVTQTSSERNREAAARTLQRRWRSLKRNAPCNELCVISMEEVPRERRFMLVLDGGSVYQYCANSLYVYLHSNLTTAEPVCRRALSTPELRRLDKLVDKARTGPARTYTVASKRGATCGRTTARSITWRTTCGHR